MVGACLNYVSIIQSVANLLLCESRTLNSLSAIPIKQLHWVHLVATSLPVARTSLVSVLFGLVRVGAPHGTVLPGHLTHTCIAKCAYSSRFFINFSAKANALLVLRFDCSIITFYVHLHHYNIISPLDVPFD